jgi:Sulfotransferase domain
MTHETGILPEGRETMVTVATLPAAVGKGIRLASKHIYQNIRWRAHDQPRVLFIVGCMRSGTTMMTRLFDADFNCRVFGEFSELSSGDTQNRIRLNPLPDVAAIINRVPAPLVVAKPLVETQHIRKLLDYFPFSKALFMYRRYADVAHSDMAKFGARNGVYNLHPIAAGDAHNWRSEGASRAVQELAARHYSQDMNPNDAAALFWYARNQLFFDQDLANHPAVMLCKYEYLTHQPAAVMRQIYDFVGVNPPDVFETAQVRPSAAAGKVLELSPEVRLLCEQLQARLDAHFQGLIGQ